MVEEKGDADAKGETYLISAHILLELESFKEARNNYQTSLKHFGNAEDTMGMAFSYLGIGQVWAAQGQDDEALRFYEKSEKIWPSENHIQRAELWSKMGSSYAAQKKFEKAEKYLNRSLSYYQKNDEIAGQAEVNYHLGNLYKEMDKPLESESAYHNCIDLGKRRNRPNDVLIGYEGLYELNKTQGKYQQALIYHEKYVDLKDQIDDDELEVKEELEKYYLEDSSLENVSYENNYYGQSNDKSENQKLWIAITVCGVLTFCLLFISINIRKKNRILQSQKESIESKNDEIDVSLKEKDLLLKEVHHRVKNNLQIISSLLNLQRHKVSDQGTLEVLGESINRIQSISLIHQKFYQSSNLAKVDFKNYLTDLMESQKRLYGNPDKPVKTMVMGKAHFVGLDTAVPLGLIIAELITNSFKHAFGTEPFPELAIRIETGEYLTITVKDNGVGLPRGFSVKNSNSLGMEIVEALSEQLFGQVSYRNEDGAVFVVRVKEISQPTT